jgi:hypothetical protein
MYREMLPVQQGNNDIDFLNCYGHYYASVNGGGVPTFTEYFGVPKYIKFKWSKINNQTYWQGGNIYVNYNPATMETITDGVYMSSDGGNTWSKNTTLKFIITQTTGTNWGWQIKLNSTLSSTAFYVNFVYTVEPPT